MGSSKSDRTDRDPLIDKVVGGYVLKERVGRGGMGTVYRAVNQANSGSVAIKVLAPFLAGDQALVARFNREASAASRVQHANVIRMHGASEVQGIHFSVMDFVDGENLAVLLKREGRLPAGRAVFIANEVATGLRALHHEGIIHRDVKPSNILIGRDGSVRITDFGIALDISEVQRLTAPGDLLGTIGFAAPEQLEGSEVDIRADLYSLGATLHYMLTGKHACTDQRIPKTALGADVPGPILDLLDRLLSKNPSNRPADAASVGSALSPFARPFDSRRGSLRDRCVRAALAVAGAGLVFWSGALAASSRGPVDRREFWSLVLPPHDALLLPTAGFCLGIVLASLALIRGRAEIGLGLRTILALSILGGSVVIAYLAGASMGSATIVDTARSLFTPSPGSLVTLALGLAALGLTIGMREHSRTACKVIGGSLLFLSLGAADMASSGGSVAQALVDLRNALGRSAWAWSTFALCVAGIVLALHQRGRLWQVLLAPLAVLASLGMMYWTSQGKDAPSLKSALAGPGAGAALALILAIIALAVLDLRPSQNSLDTGTDCSTASPPPAA